MSLFDSDGPALPPVQADMPAAVSTAAIPSAPHAERAHPTTEHFLPLLVAAGASRIATPATVLDGGIRHGVLAMESYLFGERVALQVEETVDA